MPLRLWLAGLLCTLVYCAAILGFPKPGGRVVTGDATHQFVQLRSMVFDRDLHFQNEYVHLYGLHDGPVEGTEWVFTELTPTGHVRNYMPVGPALLWAPLYVIAVAATWIWSSLTGAAAPNGFEPWLQLTGGITGVWASILAALLTWRWVSSTAWRNGGAWAIAGLWLGSHALYYTLVSPTYSHAPSMLAGALFFPHWWRWRDSPTLGAFAASGALAGAAALMRWQDALWLALPAWQALQWKVSWDRRVMALAAAGAGWLVVFSPQMYVWHVLYGSAITVPQGAAFMEWTSPNLVAMLFSDNHGWISWAPIVVPALLGLGRMMGRDRSLIVPLGFVLLSAWYVNASVADWWAGEAFGARRFLSLTPLLTMGLAAWMCAADGTVARTRTWIVLALVGLNGLLLFQYQVFMKGWRDIAPYPRGFVDLWLTRFVVPFRVLGRLF